jgi:phosphopantothenoylcysteine decarboxylase/phosphopantothenate--cysteine ligase
MAAAVADYTPVGGAATEKIAKSGDMQLPLARTRDILLELGESRTPAHRQILVGFAAETEHLVEKAQGKLHRKQVDLIVANDVTEAGAGFDVDTNKVTLVSATGVQPLPLMPKRDVAAAILDRVERLWTGA